MPRPPTTPGGGGDGGGGDGGATHRRRRARSTSPSPLLQLAGSTGNLWRRVQQRYLEERESGSVLNFTYIFSGYRSLDFANFSGVLVGVLLVIAAAVVFEAYQSAPALTLLPGRIQANIVGAALLTLTFFSGAVIYLSLRRRPVYLVDYVTFQPPERLRVTPEKFMELSREARCFSRESLDFQEKLLGRSGLGDHTYFPEAMFKAADIGEHGGDGSMVLNMDNARAEAEMVIYSVVDKALRATGTRPQDVDMLIVNCSLFNPTPSLSAMVVNRFRMNSSIRTYNLAGMGCSAGLISIDLARDLLQTHPNCTCLVVSTENITQNWYLGVEKSMLITNTLFRLGGAAILLSNKARDRRRAKYALLHTVRTHRGADDPAYNSIFQAEDKAGVRGVRLSKQIMEVAGEALRENIFRLGPLVFPPLDHVRFFVNLIRRKYLGNRSLKPYLPDFHRAFKHFCIHTGGRAVIDTLEATLKLNEADVGPSRYALRRYGNTSSASIWYELQYIERRGAMHRGERTWMIAFGSGFKCNSAVWQALRRVSPAEAGLEAEALGEREHACAAAANGDMQRPPLQADGVASRAAATQVSDADAPE